MRALIFGLMVAAGCSDGEGGDDSSAPTPCERLRDHLIDLRLADAKHVDQAAHRIAMKQAMGPEFLASCAKLESSQISCVIDAADTTSASACAPSAPRS